VAGIGAEAIADVDHRGRARLGQGAALAEPRGGVQLAFQETLAAVGRIASALPHLHQLDRRGSASELARHRHQVPWFRAAPRHEPCPSRLVADCGYGEDEHRRANQVAARDGHLLPDCHLGESVGDPKQVLIRHLLGGADDGVGLTLGGTHRREVRQRRCECLSPDSLRAERVEHEMDPVDDRVDRHRAGGAGLDHRRVVAARHAHPRPGRGHARVDCGDQVEFAAGHL